ncbi:MAG: hypothetical protein ABW352_23640 [Polyangiales bacterium]
MSSSQSELLDTQLSSMLGLPLGQTVDLTVADYQALANANLNLSAVTQALNAAGVGTDANGALNTSTSLSTVLGALSVGANANGNGAAAAALDKLRTQTASVNTQNVTLGGLIEADTRDVQLQNSQINLLDTVTGTASVFNQTNVANLRDVTVSGSALGLPSSIGSVVLSVVVVEPAVMVCGTTGTKFYSAAIRIRARINLTGQGVNLNLPPLTSLRLNLVSLDLVAAIGRAAGTITALDATARTLTVQATPGVAELYLGTISDANFLDRTTPIDPATELTPAVIANLALSVTILNATASVTARSYAIGGTPTPQNLNFTGPYEQTLTATTQAGFVNTLQDSLLNNLEVQVSAFSGNLGLTSGVLSALTTNLGTLVTNTLKSTSGLLKPVLSSVTTGVLDPLLAQLGVKLGEVSVTAKLPYKSTATTCDDGQYCTINDSCNATGVCTGTPRSCSDNKTCTVDACDEAADACKSTLDASSCLINNNCVAANAQDPNNSCLACNPAVLTTGYSLRAITGCLINDSCPNGCRIGDSCVQAGSSPTGLPCLYCNPSNPLGWSNRLQGTGCDDGLFCTTSDTCNAIGVCVGAARSCSDNLSCTTDVCSEASDSCLNAATNTGCFINGNCIQAGFDDPNNSCYTCTPAASTTTYSLKATAQCTNPNPGTPDGGTPTDGDAGTNPDAGTPPGDAGTPPGPNLCGCQISGACVATGAASPSNPCLICDPTQSTTAFSSAPSGLACSDGQFCTALDRCDGNGACVGTAATCNSNGSDCTGQVCDETNDSCTASVTVGCMVNSQCYAEGAVQPGNPCFICEGDISHTSFTYVPTSAGCVNAQDGGPDDTTGDDDAGRGDASIGGGNEIDTLDGGGDAGRDAGVDAGRDARIVADTGIPGEDDDAGEGRRGGLAGDGGCAVSGRGDQSGSLLWMLGTLALIGWRRRRNQLGA